MDPLPGRCAQPEFISEIKRQVDPEALLLFVSSSVRSDGAARLAPEAGYGNCFNILEGFKGDADASGQRNKTGGWLQAGLPWQQC